MAKGKALTLPDTPTYQDKTSGIANSLVSGDIPAWLQSAINPNNSQYALQQAQGILGPQFRDTLTQIKNEAAANGQLESSTFTDALARSQSDLNSQYQSIVSGQAINDANMSNQNKLGLFGQGLGTLQNNQNSENQFNLSNYDNLVANAIQNNKNANKANGWQQFFGMTNPLAHDYLQSQGINSVPGYGVADVAKIAGSFMGFGGGGIMGNSFGNTSPGMSASNGLMGQGTMDNYLRYTR